MFAEQQQGWEEKGWVGDGVPSSKNRDMFFCLLLLVGSMWLNSQTGGWLDGPCQCVSVSENPNKSTDTSLTKKHFP